MSSSFVIYESLHGCTFHLVQYKKAKSLCSSNVRAILRCLGFFFFCAEGACAEAKIFSEKKNFVRHFAGFNFSRLSLAFILKYYPILNVVKR